MAQKSDNTAGFVPDPFLNPLDAILANIAIAVQLPPGLHAKAGERYEAVRTYAERPGSPLYGRILQFYPQGSMAIDATISVRGTDDEYDLDIVAALALPPDAPPDEVLDSLYKAVAGYPTSQGVERQTRCVTIRYADRMHLDITPSVLLPHGLERESHIFHAHPDEPIDRHLHVPMNAYGFARWYKDRTPSEKNFADAFSERVRVAKAKVDEIPSQTPVATKSVATVALQLLKRFRNVTYASSKGRIPPSVMLSCFAGYVAQPDSSLSDMLIRQARFIAQELRRAYHQAQKIFVVNPVFQRDCFTDRWPESLSQQKEFSDKLTLFADGLESLKNNEADLEFIKNRLREYFGDYVVSSGINRFNQTTGQAVQSGTAAYTSFGGVFVPSVTGRPVFNATPHTFRGDRR